MINIRDDIRFADCVVQSIKLRYIEAIQEGITQNLDLIKINDSGFTINFSNLSEDVVLSPSYYDFELQRDIIIAAIKQLPLKKLPTYLSYIMKKGNLPSNTPIKDGDKILYAGNYNFRFNPRVITRLKKIISVDDEETNNRQ